MKNGFAFCFFLTLLWARVGFATPNYQGAIEFLDAQGGQWITDHRCISCHASWSYGFGRIGTPGWENSPVREIENYMMRRLENPARNQPWYGTRGSERGMQSFGSESVLSAFILAEMDQARDLTQASMQTRAAIQWMFSLQNSDGSFPWLDYNLQPLESGEAAVFGAALAQIAVARSHIDSRSEYSMQMDRLGDYLQRQFRSRTTDLYFKASIAWAAVESPGLLPASEIETFIRSLMELRRPDGGWSMNSLGHWMKQGNSPRARGNESDPNATSYLLLILGRINNLQPRISGLSEVVEGARSWLISHQDMNGSWEGISINRDDPTLHSHMRNLATGLSVKAIGNF